ncbi:MAG: hypothetical protein R2797_10515 [Gelidibacter sp.]
MKLKFTLIIILLLVFRLNAQVDTSQKSVPIPAEENKEEKKEVAPTPILIKPEDKPSLTTKKENISGIPIQNRVTMKPSEKEFSMMDKSTLLNPGQIFEDKWANEKRKEQLEIYENIPPELLGDQFLGDFKLRSEFVNVICRDFGEEDGDLIKVLINDKIVIALLELTHGYKTFKLPLEEGINKIDFFALNQGSLGFNTAQFELFDDQDHAISKNNWFLATGKKATLIIIKE